MENQRAIESFDERSDLNRDGFAVLTNVISASRADTLAETLAGLGAGYGMRNLLHACPPVASLARELKALVAIVLGADAFAARGIFFDKLPGANWEVGWHQDLSIAVAERIDAPGFGGWSVKRGVPHVQPPVAVLERMLTVRLHLDDCGADNGPLRVLRGSHARGRLKDEEIEHWEQNGKEVACLVPKGGALLMRPLLLHASAPAKKPCHRRVIHLEYAADPLPHGLKWFEAAGN
jgi:ectoine hydroxylase-related dioxygenase (phytanoyl-CoA dioxygenase family)